MLVNERTRVLKIQRMVRLKFLPERKKQSTVNFIKIFRLFLARELSGDIF